jgi:hypothetical protein
VGSSLPLPLPFLDVDASLAESRLPSDRFSRLVSFLLGSAVRLCSAAMAAFRRGSLDGLLIGAPSLSAGKDGRLCWIA